MIRMGYLLLLAAVLGGKSFGASFDCKKEGLTGIENTICAHSGLSRLDSQLGSVYAVARATAGDGAKDALLESQKSWLATRNRCSSEECLRAAYNDRIAELLASPNVRSIDFELLLAAGPVGWEPQCREVPLTYFGPIHIEPWDLPPAFAEFIPFIPPGAKVLDLRCGDIKGDGSMAYLLVTREPHGIPGTLTLLSRSQDGSLRVDCENGSIIQTDAAGTEGGYAGISLRRKGFAVRNTFGSAGTVGSFKFTFRYVTTTGTWMLESIATDTQRHGNVPPHSRERLTKATFGDVTFAAFEATPYGIALR